MNSVKAICTTLYHGIKIGVALKDNTIPREDANKILDELAEWANRHGVSFKATEAMLEECPALQKVIKLAL